MITKMTSQTPEIPIPAHEPSAAAFVRSETSSDRPALTRLVLSDNDHTICDDYIRAAETLSDGNSRPTFFRENDVSRFAGSTDQHSVTVLIFLDGSINPRSLKIISLLLLLARDTVLRCVVVIPSLRSHLDRNAESELDLLLSKRLKPHLAALTVIRTGIIASGNSRFKRWCTKMSWLGPLLSPRLSSTFVDIRRLSQAVEQELASDPALSEEPLVDRFGVRRITVVGSRREWSSVLNEAGSSERRMMTSVLRAVSQGAAVLGGRWIMLQAIRLLSYCFTTAQTLVFTELKPQSNEELLQLFNRHGYDDLQIAGYNNGVNHFGWRFPTKTIVSTSSIRQRGELISLQTEGSSNDDHDLNHVSRVATGKYRAHAGTLLRDAIDELAKTGHEFFVTPNFSYVSLGTLFFVPIHGSGCHVSTLGDTIAEVQLWNVRTEESITLRRSDPLFREIMYCRNSPWIALTLTLWVKKKSSYIRQTEQVEDASAVAVLGFLNDEQASHVEIRKARASSNTIDVNRYLTVDQHNRDDISRDTPNFRNTQGQGTAQDKIGRLWDRLEETPVASTLFHWFVRTYLFHVELFLTPEEFQTLWHHHQSLPISKIQIRRVLRDGILHSACSEHDCIAADIIMSRRSKDAFCRFVREFIPNVHTNPGKQSF